MRVEGIEKIDRIRARWWLHEAALAHREIDLARPKGNQKNSGFLPEERAELDRIAAAGWVDTFRAFEPDGDHYSWWSQRFGMRAKNVGWRIDYQFVSPGLRDRLRGCSIYRDERFSDHAPFTVDYAP